ncbi:MAG: polysaccharide deacetylase family protein [Candidatus Pacebacteria bacterium]|nr:polysaccharide deacetylase family protein [Candidatus Paceibacterota bacterium]
MNHKRPALVISLDFELFWGMFDKVTIAEYGQRILGERQAIPRMLELFQKYEIHATWATVGMLMHEGKDDLLSGLPPPEDRPHYEDESYSSYHYIENAPLGETESVDQYHFGPSLVKLIQNTPHQELASHTYSHFYGIDGGENSEAVFAADCAAFSRIAKRHNFTPTAIVFPRNQANGSLLGVCKEHGIRAYRGNENHFLYRARKDNEQSPLIRGLRLLDHYVNISGHHGHLITKAKDGQPINVPASRFLRPYSKALRHLEQLRMHRIKTSMTHAAKNGEVFHLWWHPHNFGADLEENIQNLTTLLEHFKTLREKYQMESLTMTEAADLVAKF